MWYNNDVSIGDNNSNKNYDDNDLFFRNFKKLEDLFAYFPFSIMIRNKKSFHIHTKSYNHRQESIYFWTFGQI